MEWQAMDDCIKSLEHGGSLNIRSWGAAMCWTMMPCEAWRLDFLPPRILAPEFRDAIRVSGHTCWEEWEMKNYAVAMAFLREDPKVVGLKVWKDSRCQVCRLQWRLRNLGETLPVEERAFEADLTELEDITSPTRGNRLLDGSEIRETIIKTLKSGSEPIWAHPGTTALIRKIRNFGPSRNLADSRMASESV
ncbi:hypothetical protein C8J56DRAFT_1085113 [Mycena floridula]|nr:hypothetical protein C8J56DRAFT_1085113 [Mycena floridula]